MAGGAWNWNFADGYQPGDILTSLFGMRKPHENGEMFSDNPSANAAKYGTSLFDDITGLSNTWSQNSAAANLQEDAQSFSKESMQNQHQWEVQDLQKAGLNPWLSAGGGVTAASAGIAGTQASNVNALASIGTAAAGLGILIKAVKAVAKK